MLTRFFRQDHPTAFLPIPLLLLLLWPGAGTGAAGWSAAATAALDHTVRGMPLYLPFRWLMALAPWVTVAVAVLWVCGLAYSLNRMANDAELYDRRNHLPVLLLPLLLALMPFGLMPGPAFMGGWFVVRALGIAWTTTDRKGILSPLFDAGLLLGLASAFYLPYIFLIVVIWATLAVTRPFHWREHVLPAIGVAVMFFLCWGLVHFIDPGAWQPVASLHFPADTPKPPQAHWMYGVVLTAVLLALAVAVALSFASVYARSVMREKNIRASFLAFAFAMGLIALFAWLLDGRIPPVLLALPAALLLTYPLLQGRGSAWTEAAAWSLLLLAGWARWMG
jgi:hypothetical protein